MPTASPTARLTAMRMIAGAFFAAVVMFALVVSLIVPSEYWFEMPDILGLALPAVAGVAAAGGIVTVGHNVVAIAPTDPADRATATAVNRFQASMFVRLAFAELPAFVGLAAVLVSAHPSAIPFLIGAVFSLVLHAVYAFPTRASVRRVERKLDREGGRSRLAESFGFGSGPGNGYTGSATVH